MGKVSWPERSSDAAFGCSTLRGCRGLVPSRGEGSAGSSGPGGLPSGSGGSTTGAGSVLLRSRRGEGCRLCRLGGGGLWFWNLTVFTCCSEKGTRHHGAAGGLLGMLWSPLSSQGCPLGVCAVTCPLGAPGGESCQQGDDGVSAFLPRQCRSGCQWGEKSPFQAAQPVTQGRFGGTPECCTAQPSGRSDIQVWHLLI